MKIISIKKIVTFFTLAFILSIELLATGPSHIESEMKPISINDKGEILCRTRFSKNPMGGHSFMDVEYGFCVVTNDTILQFQTHVLSYGGYPTYESYEKQRVFWDSIYDSRFDLKNQSSIEYSVTYEYKFKEMDMTPFYRNDTITAREFEKEKRMKLQKIPQKALYGAKSSSEDDYYKIVNVLYDFGNIVFLNNQIATECGDLGNYFLGSDFDYPNLYEGQEGQNIGYDCLTVTGVLFLK